MNLHTDALAAQIAHHFDGNDDGSKVLRPGVYVARLVKPLPRTPTVYKTMVCFLAQGRKTVYWGDSGHTYGNGSFLLSQTTAAVDVEAVDISPQHPLLGMALELDLKSVRRLILELGEHAPRLQTPTQSAITAHPIDDVLLDALCRLMRAAQSDMEWRALGESVKREVHYHLLLGSAGALINARLAQMEDLEPITRTIDYIEQHLSATLTVSALARVAGLSASALHTRFKRVTAQSPIQFVKRLRLNRAHMLIRSGVSVTNAAYEVGYASPSQFSREFRRQYGVVPSQLAYQVPYEQP